MAGVPDRPSHWGRRAVETLSLRLWASSAMPPSIVHVLESPLNNALDGEPAPRETAITRSVRDHLSPRELQVLEMTSEGLTNAQIAARLGVTVHAVKFHLASIYRQLGVANRTEAAVMFLRSPQIAGPYPGEGPTTS